MTPLLVLLLVGTIAALLGVFVLAVTLLTRSYRRRMGRRPGRPTIQTPDAWREAGRRLKE